MTNLLSRFPARLSTREWTDLLELVLEAIPTIALVATERGEVLFANPAAREWMAAPDSEARAVLARLPRPPEGMFTTRTVGVAGRTRFLLLGESLEQRLARRVWRAAARWGLTPRQTRTLILLGAGEEAATIADVLETTCDEVAQQIRDVLRRAGVPNRAALIAALWCEERGEEEREE